MTCEKYENKFEKTAKNGWFYDKTFGTKVEVVKQTVPAVSLNE